MTLLVIAEHNHAAINGATLNAIAAAREIGGDIHVLVAGYNAGPAATAASQIAGVAKVLHSDAAHYAGQTAENIAALVVSVAGGYDYIVTAATGFGKNVSPRIAALLDVAQVSEIVSIESPDTFVRPIYAGNGLATVRSTDPKKVITVRATGFDPVAATGGSAAIESIPATADTGLSTVTGQSLSKSDRPELTAARIVISGGRGVGNADNFKSLLEPLAARLNAALGASRAAVDAGFVPNEYQVGQTGKIVAPDLYIAVGISGAIQHLAGMKDSKVIVAINKDADAPIFAIADYGLVGDLFEVVPALVKELG